MRAALFGVALVAMLSIATPSHAALRVVATTTDLASLTAEVGGDVVVVDSIVPPGVDPEAFEPRPADLEKLRNAGALVRVGLGYDFWVDALVARAGNKRLMRGGDGDVDASLGVPLLEIRGRGVVNQAGHAHGHANPHYWLDPENAIIMTAGIAEMLVRRAPEHRERIVANRERFVGKLRAQLARWTDALAPHAGSKVIAYHNTWPYFARRFRLDIVDFIEPKAGVAPSPAHLARVISKGRSKQVKAILHEPYEPENASRFVAQKLGVPLVKLATSVRSMPETADYSALIDYNVTAIARAFAARNP
ncbi:MAG TPA: metal ABC transporter substrate-binding protein [Casimicrobiaceae bacterium]